MFLSFFLGGMPADSCPALGWGSGNSGTEERERKWKGQRCSDLYTKG